MSEERTCQGCGASLKPAMLKCVECGTRVSLRHVEQSATALRTAAASKQHARIIGVTTATLSRSRIVGQSPVSVSQTATSRLSHAVHKTEVATAAIVSRPQQKLDVDSDTDFTEGRIFHGGAPANSPHQDSRICECPCGARFRFPPHMVGMRRRCRKCRQPLVLPEADLQSGTPKALLAADANDTSKEAIDRAVARLAAVDSDVCTGAGRTLSRKRLREYTANLETDASSQSSVDLRRLTILKLGRSGDARAFGLIEPFVVDSQRVVRKAVATAVGELRDRRGVRLALQLLCDKDAAVVGRSIKSLNALADPIAIRPLMFVGLSDPMLRAQAIEAVVGFGDEGLAELLEIIETRNPLTLPEAVIALGRIGNKRAVPSLLMMLDHADAGLRARIAEALGRLGDRSALGKIISLLSDSDEAVQLCAVRAVQRIPDRRAARPLLAILSQTENSDLRCQAVIALAATGSEKVIPALTALLPDADVELKRAIAEALSRIGTAGAAETLATLLHADDLVVVTKALIGLRRRPVVSSTPAVLQLCEHPNASIRRHAVETLAESGQDVVFDVLLQKLQSDLSAEVRAAAARGCGKTNDKRFVRTLETALRDEPAVRIAALVSLTSLGDESSIPAMLVSLSDEVPEVRYHAVTGLGKLNADKAAQAIRSMLEDESEMVRLGANSALLNLGLQDSRILMSRRILKRASTLVPDSVAGVMPAATVLAGAAIVIAACVAGWSAVSSFGSGVDRSIALARAKPVIEARWLPGATDVILLRNGGLADVWDGATGEFKTKVIVPALAECRSPAELMSKQGDTMVAWAPDGYQAASRILKVPPSENFSLSGDGKFAAYLGRNRRVWIWDTVEGKDVVDLGLQPVPLPVLNSDGTIVAGEDKKGNIVLIDLATRTTVGERGAAGNNNSSENGAFKKMIFSSRGNTLAVIRTDRVVFCKVTGGELSVSEIKERVDPTVTQFLNESAIYSAWESSITRLDLTTGSSKKWSVSNMELTINSLSISEDESLAAVSADGKKFGWIVSLTDGSPQQLSPLAWPSE